MNLIQQSATLESVTPNALQLIERCGRTAYKSEDKITDESAPDFVRMLLKRKHESVLEHASATIRFVCDRGISHELVRHRLCAFTQESTRYCRYEGDLNIIVPTNNQGIDIFLDRDAEIEWKRSLTTAERRYNMMLQDGVAPEFARSVLPTCVKTEIVVTANFREWRHILRLRLAPTAHPQMQFVMRLALCELITAVPVVFDEFLPPECDWVSPVLREARVKLPSQQSSPKG